MGVVSREDVRRLLKAVPETRLPLAEEAAGRDGTNVRTRRARAGVPAGKTLPDRDAASSTIPRPTQDALTGDEARPQVP